MIVTDNLNVNDPTKISNEVQLSSLDQENKTVDSQLNNSMEKVDNDQDKNNQKDKDKDNKSKDLNESLLSDGTNKSHTKSIKKVTFDFKSDMNSNTINEIEEINITTQSQPKIDDNQPSDEANPVKPDDNLDKFSNNKESHESNINDHDDLQIREDFDEDVDSPIKNNANDENDNDIFCDTLESTTNLDPTKFQTMDSTYMSNTQTTMVMDEDSDDDMVGMPDIGQFSQYTQLNNTLEWFKKYV